MNQVIEEKKEAVTKTFAIVGFVAIVLFTVWLAVQVVSVVPSAFSSLASLANSIYNYDTNEELVVATGSTIANTGESFNISWTHMQNSGTYAFSYACTDGVSVDIKDPSGDIIALACDTTWDLGDVVSLAVVIASEKHRFADIPYTVSFTETGVPDSITSTTKAITIVNATIPTSESIATEEAEEISEEEVEQEETTNIPTNTAGTPTTVEKLIYAIPTSNPNGKIDLAVTYLGMGILTGKIFTPTQTIGVNQNGAIQFEVKNIGTKTAEDWSYEANLPADMSFSSGDQKALKPNERAVITLGFEGVSRTGVEKFDVSVTAKNDISKLNNSFTRSVLIVR